MRGPQHLAAYVVTIVVKQKQNKIEKAWRLRQRFTVRHAKSSYQWTEIYCLWD